MNSLKSALIGLGVFFLSSAAFADFNSVELLEATKITVEEFELSNAHAAHFVGYKAWKSGADAKVKIYVDHDGMEMEFDYLCIKYDDATECQTL